MGLIRIQQVVDLDVKQALKKAIARTGLDQRACIETAIKCWERLGYPLPLHLPTGANGRSKRTVMRTPT